MIILVITLVIVPIEEILVVTSVTVFLSGGLSTAFNLGCRRLVISFHRNNRNDRNNCFY